jgi:hypothetical protein
LGPRERPAVFRVDERDAAAGERVRLEAAQQADRVGVEVEDAVRRRRTAEKEQPARGAITAGRAPRRGGRRRD